MGGHYETWKLWLKKISPMGPVFEPVDSSALVAMAESLAMAAPNGPQGFPCVDECHCDDTIHVAQLFEALMEEGLDITLQLREKLMAELTWALRKDRTISMRDMRQWQQDVGPLARWRTIVSDTNARVAHVRALYPNTWKVIKELGR
jgi:hypothetical protein